MFLIQDRLEGSSFPGVDVKSWGWAVFDDYGWVINNPMSAPPNRERRLQVITHLCSHSAEARVEWGDRNGAKRHVRTLQEVDVLKWGPEMVVADQPSIPSHPSHDPGRAFCHNPVLDDDVPSSDGANCRIFAKSGCDFFEPI
jgi:hypothetical protein